MTRSLGLEQLVSSFRQSTHPCSWIAQPSWLRSDVAEIENYTIMSSLGVKTSGPSYRIVLIVSVAFHYADIFSRSS